MYISTLDNRNYIPPNLSDEEGDPNLLSDKPQTSYKNNNKKKHFGN